MEYNSANKSEQAIQPVFIFALIVWILFGAFLLFADSVQVNFPGISFAQNTGKTLEPMRPVSERRDLSTTVSYATTSAPELTGYYVSGTVATQDLRAAALERYLSSKGSPMADHADLIVAESDKNDIDYKVFVAISGVESGFGQAGRAARVGHNPIGWRGGPGGRFNIFSDWEESIPYLVGGLARGYGSEPDPFAIQGTYCPPCEAAGTNEWANGVTRNINDIQSIYDSI